ncbi:hypothetical protein NUACC26_008370 [Scytonema sp. NUACC26]
MQFSRYLSWLALYYFAQMSAINPQMLQNKVANLTKQILPYLIKEGFVHEVYIKW